MTNAPHFPSLCLLTAAVATVLGCTADVSDPEGDRTAELAVEDVQLVEVEGLPDGMRVRISGDEDVITRTVDAAEATTTFDELLGRHAWVSLEITEALEVRD